METVGLPSYDYPPLFVKFSKILILVLDAAARDIIHATDI